MWIEEISLENIKCFEKQTIKLGDKKGPYKWINFLGENGTGKSSVLQSIALLLAGPEGAKQLLLKPDGWLKDDGKQGKITITLHQGDNDPGIFGGEKKERKKFRYTFYITGDKSLNINNKTFTEPTIAEDTKNKALTWLRENALLPKGKGWFGAGYGAFRRLTRANRILVPSLQTPFRYTNFFTQFKEDDPIEAFETWMIYLDYRISKSDDQLAKKQKDWGIKAINRLLPHGNVFDSIDDNGKIWFLSQGTKVSTVALSDGFRSILALAGDLIWRLIEAFPDSDDPLSEEGVVMIDELDIHLHPTWQRSIAELLQKTFPNIQFIIAIHSPLIAAGAGEDAKCYRFYRKENNVEVEQIKNIHAFSVDKILQSEAFGVVSPFSPETQSKIDIYYALKNREKSRPLTNNEQLEMNLVIPTVKEAFGKLPISADSLEYKIDKFLEGVIS